MNVEYHVCVTEAIIHPSTIMAMADTSSRQGKSIWFVPMIPSRP